MQDHDDQAILRIRQILQHWLVFEIEETSYGCLANAQYALPPWACPGCDTINPDLRRYGTKEQIIVLPILWLKIKTIRQRYQCRACGATFWELLDY